MIAPLILSKTPGIGFLRKVHFSKRSVHNTSLGIMIKIIKKSLEMCYGQKMV